MTELQAAIELLYEAFAHCPRPEKIRCCPCGCTEPGATDHLLAVPIRALRFSEIADYAFSAMTTQGTVDDFRYLLPRLFEGITQEPYNYNPEILFGKLSYAKWMTWPEGEFSAIRRYMRAFWRASLESFPLEARLPGIFEIETVLCSIARTGEPLDDYLGIWTENRTQNATSHLVQFVTMYGGDISNGSFFHDGFWKDSQDQVAVLRRWLKRPATMDRLENSRHLVKEDGFEHLYPLAIEALKQHS